MKKKHPNLKMTSSTGDENFDVAFQELIAHEGGYVDHPSDPGGATKYGISLRWLRGIYRNADKTSIKNLTLEKARELYYEHWWKRYRYGELPAGIARKVFNTGVNMGNRRAIRLLQRSVWSAGAKAWKIADDGILGPATLKAVKNSNQDRLVAAFRSEQAAYYRELVAKRPSMGVFLKGWLKRAYS